MLDLLLLAIVFVPLLFQYAAHRSMHAVAWLWRFHAIHHSSRALDWLAGSRLHLVDIAIVRAVTFLPEAFAAQVAWPFRSG